jgi:hypothetical protein
LGARNANATKGERKMATWEQHMSDLVHNERIKYGATFLNNSGVAALAAGVIVPIADTSTPAWILFWGGCLLAAAFNGAALWILGNLREEPPPA